MIFYVILVCIVLVALTVTYFLYWKIHKTFVEEKTAETEGFESFLSLTVNDVVKLANNSYIEQLDNLIKESNVASKLPIFYDNYLALNKANKEAYFQNLLDILRKTELEDVDELLNTRSDISTQEILLLILMKTKLENKIIAKLLFINQETLKKRKSRLKLKMERK